MFSDLHPRIIALLVGPAAAVGAAVCLLNDPVAGSAAVAPTPIRAEASDTDDWCPSVPEEARALTVVRDGRPCAGARLEVRLADGRVRTARADGTGRLVLPEDLWLRPGDVAALTLVAPDSDPIRPSLHALMEHAGGPWSIRSRSAVEAHSRSADSRGPADTQDGHERAVSAAGRH